jgi:DNA-directed RNA polymerase subunit M/transcription elongation factor TFIIS
MDKECQKCGGWMELQDDYENGIEYYICRKCGNVEFLIDGLGGLNNEQKEK